MPKLLLTEAQRQLLKKPLGELVTGTPSECSRKIKEVQDAEKPRRLILVGDTVSRNAIQSGIKPDVIIIDHKEKRSEAVEFTYEKTRVFRMRNEAGTIDLLAWSAIAEAIEKGDSAVIVDGEEDLLALVAVAAAPEGSLVVYGQPEEGVVLVRASMEMKNEIRRIVDDMQRAD
jgi:hypothetical protein